MIHLLFTVIFAEMTLIMILSFKTPFRKMAILTMDKVKRGRGPMIVKTVSATIFTLLLSNVYGMMEIQNRSPDAATMNPTDQVLSSRHLLEASLMACVIVVDLDSQVMVYRERYPLCIVYYQGFTLFLALIIDRIHHYIRELRLLRKAMQALKDNQNSGDKKTAVSE